MTGSLTRMFTPSRVLALALIAIWLPVSDTSIFPQIPARPRCLWVRRPAI